MTRYYVNIAGLELEKLNFFGFQLVEENEEFALYIDGNGDPQVVDKKSPHIFVDDINDARHIDGRIIELKRKTTEN